MNLKAVLVEVWIRIMISLAAVMVAHMQEMPLADLINSADDWDKRRELIDHASTYLFSVLVFVKAFSFSHIKWSTP